MNNWISVKNKRRLPKEFARVDLWLQVPASPMSMGIADAWRVPDAYLASGKWFHIYNGKQTEINGDYVTHWMKQPEPPK